MSGGFAGGDVEALVVEGEGRVVVGGGGDERVEEGFVQIGGKLLQLLGDANGGNKGAVGIGVGESGWCEGDVRFGVVEAGVEESFGSFRRDREMGRGFPVAEIIAEGRLLLKLGDAGIEPSQIRAAAALGDEPATGLECAEEASEKGFVIVNPVKRGGAEDTVGHGFEIEGSHIGGEDLYTFAKLRSEKVASAADHVFGEVAGKNGALRKALGKLGGESPSAAAGVEHGFITAKLDAFEDFESPTELRIGDGVIRGSVPLFALAGWVVDGHRSMMPQGGADGQTSLAEPVLNRLTQVLDPGMCSGVETWSAWEVAVAAEGRGGTLRSGELARLAGVSSDLLRHYERIGVLPRAERGANGYRRYPASVLSRVRAARRAVSLGFTLAELARMFSIRDRGGVPCRQVRALAEERLKRLDEALVETRNLRRQLEKIVREWDHRLGGRRAGQRADLLHSLDAMPLAANARVNPKRKGWRAK